MLTALLAEQAVQSLEWRQKVNAAIDDMRQELGVGDGPQAYARLAMHACLDRRLQAVQQAVEQGDRQASRKAIGAIWLPARTYDSLAHDTAVSSDVSSHMPAQRMYEFRIVYALVPELNELHRKELVDLARLRALPESGAALDSSEKLALLGAVENLKLDSARIARAAAFTLRHMRTLGIGLDPDSLARNLGEIRPAYGDCLTQDIKPLIEGAATDPW